MKKYVRETENEIQIAAILTKKGEAKYKKNLFYSKLVKYVFVISCCLHLTPQTRNLIYKSFASCNFLKEENEILMKHSKSTAFISVMVYYILYKYVWVPFDLWTNQRELLTREYVENYSQVIELKELMKN